MRGGIIQSLIKIGKPSVPPLMTLLKDRDRDIRRFAVRAFGEIKDPQAIPETLRDSEKEVRRRTIEALEIIGAPAVVPLVQALLQREMSRYAAEALGAREVLNWLEGK